MQMRKKNFGKKYNAGLGKALAPNVRCDRSESQIVCVDAAEIGMTSSSSTLAKLQIVRFDSRGANSKFGSHRADTADKQI